MVIVAVVVVYNISICNTNATDDDKDDDDELKNCEPQKSSIPQSLSDVQKTLFTLGNSQGYGAPTTLHATAS